MEKQGAKNMQSDMETGFYVKVSWGISLYTDM